MSDLDDLVALVRTAPGLLGKRDLEIVSGLDPSLDGDDGALIAHGDGFFVVCGEAISPPFLLADPYGAGSAAVVTNVSDVRAMGARPHGIVDMLVSPDRAHADRVLEGLRWAADKLGVPILGGHLTLGHAPALSASATGFTRAPLSAANAKPGDILLAAFATDGRYMSDANDSSPRCTIATTARSRPTARR
jgi:selenophosphate synthetase-related protein